MLSFKQGLKVLIKKLEFNPVDLGGNTIFTTTLGITLGAIVMIIVISYAIGKVSSLYGPPNVVSTTFEYQNDPYELDLTQWQPRISIYEKISKKYISADQLFEMGLNITAWNVQGQELTKFNPSAPIFYSSDPATITIDTIKTPFKISGSNYVHGSPQIKQYLIQIKFCESTLSAKCNNSTNRIYQITLYLKPKWTYLDNPRQPAIREMNFNEKVTIDRTKSTYKLQYTYDIFGFNVTSDRSLLPDFFPRQTTVQNGSSMAGPPTKIYLPQEAQNIVQFHFRRAQTSQAYTRKYNSIDVIFADILGVVALFGLILWVLLAHYSSWGSEQYILRSITGQNRSISLLTYLKFYLTCKKRSQKEQKILSQVHNNIIESYKQRKRRKVDIEVLRLRVEKMENKLGLQGNEKESKRQILQKLEEQENKQLFSSSILTDEIRRSLLTN